VRRVRGTCGHRKDFETGLVILKHHSLRIQTLGEQLNKTQLWSRQPEGLVNRGVPQVAIDNHHTQARHCGRPCEGYRCRCLPFTWKSRGKEDYLWRIIHIRELQSTSEASERLGENRQGLLHQIVMRFERLTTRPLPRKHKRNGSEMRKR